MIGDLQHQIVEFGSARQKETINLRELVLRIPLGMRFTSEQLEAERNQIHIAQLHKTVLTACLVMKPISERISKMRQVAVHPDFQQKGLGTALVVYTEELMRKKGFKEIQLHARILAVDFYEKLDYKVVGDAFDEIGIEHYKMIKPL